jgi:4-diphosphocytidyl-2-C-methyl-D-erythritol kinase
VKGAGRAGEAGGESRWPAPAKINLFLHVTGRRPDGYHELQTLFQLIDLCDTIAIRVREDGVIERPVGPAGVEPQADLAVRAAHALKAASGTRLGATLRVLKRIPQGGGLGGGSSDAATTLRALPELARLGLALGADVPVFVEGSSAWGEGLGERLTPVALPPRWYAIIHPGLAVRTAEVFQSPELTRNSPLITIRGFCEPDGRNDCEKAVRTLCPEVGAALEWLSALAPARLSGTGSCVFASCASAAEAERIASRVPDRWTSFVARGLDRSPLLERLGVRAGRPERL